MLSGEIYKADNRISSMSILIYLVFACTVIPLLSIGYSIAIWFTPFIYFNFILTVVYGILLGFTVYPIVRWGLVRSHTLEVVVILIIWMTGLYFSWTAHITLFENMSGELIGFTLGDTYFSWDTFFALLFNPGYLLADLSLISKYGFWAIGSITFKDVGLWVVWLIEAIVILIAMWRINGRWGAYPFSEIGNKWHQKHRLNNKIPVYRGFSVFIQALKEDQLGCLLTTPFVQPGDEQFTELVIYATSRDPVAYLAFYNQTVRRDKNGKYVKAYKLSSEFYAITTSQKEQLIKHYS